MEFGLYDIFTRATMARAAVEADVYEMQIRNAVEAERLGYKYYFTIEHQSSTMSYLSSPNVYLSALARETGQLRFGVMCYQLPFHNPIRLAQDVATLDHLSRGRLEVGCGTGVAAPEFTRWNLPFAMRRKMTEEALQVMLQAWTQDSVTFEGEFYSCVEALVTPKPLQKPYPPIWFAAHSTPSFEFAARMNLNVAQNLDTDATLAAKFAAYRARWAQHGHPGPAPRTFLTRNVHVARTDELAHAQAAEHVLSIRVSDPPISAEGLRRIERRKRPEGDLAHLEEGDTNERAELRRVFKERANNYPFWIENGLAVVGSPETVIEKLRVVKDQLGLDVFCPQHAYGNMDPGLSSESMRLFATEVMPAFA
jgi:alkanesulfonate monooxygenase SsuD/methylene tetrahydromethanopterin reductase-like flavin-dependent oxidoreductase (luciferase family)